MAERKSDFSFYMKRALIGMIIGLGAMIWLRADLLYSSPQPDESRFLYIGRLLFSGGTVAHNDLPFSSQLPAYIMGIGDAMGGLMGGRILALVLGLLSIFLFYKLSKSFTGDSTASFFSAFLFAMQAPHIFMSKSATNDIISLCFFIWAIWMGIEAFRKESTGNARIALASVLFVAAVLCNYYLLFYVPFFIAAAFIADKKKAITYSAILVVLLGIYHVFHWNASDFWQYAVPMAGEERRSYLKVLVLVFEYLLMPIVLFVIAGDYSFRVNLGKKTLLYLAAMALPFVLFHLATSSITAVHRNMVFALVFILIPTGSVVKDFLRKDLSYWIAAIILLSSLGGIAIYENTRLERSYPNTSNIVKYLQLEIDKRANILSEDPYLAPFNFYPQIKQDMFYRTDNYAGQTGDRTIPYILNDIKNGKFQYIIINGLENPTLARKIRNGITKDLYRLPYSEDFTDTKIMNYINLGTYELYKRKY